MRDVVEINNREERQYMNAMQRKALEYVRNTAGCASVAVFLEDHEPVGQHVWDSLVRDGFVTTMADRIFLSQAGVDALKVLR